MDLADLILNICILLGFDKIFNRIFWFKHVAYVACREMELGIFGLGLGLGIFGFWVWVKVWVWVFYFFEYFNLVWVFFKSFANFELDNLK